MLINIMTLLLVIGFITSFIGIKVKEIRLIAFLLSACCLGTGFYHYKTVIEAEREFVYYYNISDVEKKIEYFNRCQLSDEIKNNIIYSISDNLEKLSLSSFKNTFIDNKNEVISNLLFERIKEKGYLFTKEQINCFIDSFIKDNKCLSRKFVIPSTYIIDVVLEEANNCLENMDKAETAERLNKLIIAFPEVFSKKDGILSKNIVESFEVVKKFNDSKNSLLKELARLNDLREECSDKLMRISINWILRGTVFKKIDSIENGYIIKDANVEGKNLNFCVLVTSNTNVEINQKITLSVKDIGEQYIEIENGFATYRGLKEDNSFETRDACRAEVDKCDEDIKKCNSEISEIKDKMEAYDALFNVSMRSLKKNLSQKVSRYEL